MVWKTEVIWHDDKIIKLGKAVVKNVEYESAKRILKDAKRFCPVGKQTRKGYGWKERRPGTLRASIRIHKSKFPDGGYAVFAGGVVRGRDAYYAKFVELGTPGTHIKTGHKTILSHKGLLGSSMVTATFRKRTPIPKKPFLRRAMLKEDRRFYRELKAAMNAK